MSETHENNQQEELPTWDLTEYYNGLDDPEIIADIYDSKTQAKDFANRYQGRVAELTGDQIAHALEERRQVSHGVMKAYYYAFFQKSLNGADPVVAQLNQSVNEATSAVDGDLLFFQLELRALPEEVLRQKVAESPKLQQYGKLIDDLIAAKQYALPDEAEKLLQALSPVNGMDQFIRLFEEDRVRRRYPLNDEMLTEEEIKLQMKSSNKETRKAAWASYQQVTANEIHIPAHAMNVIMGHKAVVDGERGYAHPMQARNNANNIEDEVVNTLIDTVKENYATTQHRLKQLEKTAFKIKRADQDEQLEAKAYTWEEAKTMVLEAYHGFSPEMGAIAEKFFENGWIDAKPRPGKRTGAYSMRPHPGEGFHPHILMNFQGSARNVITLARELGHGIQQYMEKETQPELLVGTPLTLAETASIFGENIVFRKLMAQAQSNAERCQLLFDQLGGDVNKAVRQIRFVDFERRIHEARKDGELTPKDFGRHWFQTGNELNGGDANGLPEDDDLDQHGWSTIPHMFRTPFYVYAYSFGQLLVNGMFRAYENDKVENFPEKCVDALKAGGTKHHSELLAPFGLDASQKQFWQDGLDVIIHRLDQLETLLEQEQERVNAQPKAEEKTDEPKAANDNGVAVESVEVVGGVQAKDKAQGKGRG